jgi:hypothetical protein
LQRRKEPQAERALAGLGQRPHIMMHRTLEKCYD